MTIPPTFKSALLATAFSTLASGTIMAKTVDVTIPVIEKDVVVDNKGTTHRMWTYGGTIPGPVLRVTEGDTVNFTLVNQSTNENSHSIDLHAALVDVLDEFSEIKPGDEHNFTFEANHVGVFMYHCGASSMAEHISRGMYGVIIVDPKDGYSEAFPKPDREYVLVQGDLFEDGTSAEDRMMSRNWIGTLVNGKVFHYDPVHDTNASQTLLAEPGERVRLYYVNAMINEAAAMHPIAGIWDRVWDNGNPLNISYGLQTVEVAPAHGMILDIVPPANRDSNNAIVDHRMKHALTGGITVLMTYEGTDPEAGTGANIIIR